MVTIMRAAGVLSFVGMVVLYKSGCGAIYVAAAYVARTAFMNCTAPLEEGLLMDYAPKLNKSERDGKLLIVCLASGGAGQPLSVEYSQTNMGIHSLLASPFVCKHLQLCSIVF